MVTLTDAEGPSRAFNRCEIDILSQPELNDSELLYCPRVFDGWGCWNDTPAGQIATIQCPDFVLGFEPNRFAHKICLEDGTWFKHPLTNITWSNYTTCVDTASLDWNLMINNINIAGYSISLVALLFSLCIFFYFKSLRCTRIAIHKNLFISFIINNSVWIIWYKTVIVDPAVLSENGAGCQILHILIQYFLASNYFWMFCEGLYLHTLLVIAFVNEEAMMKWFYIIGWVVPAIFTTIYASVRSFDPVDAVNCWVDTESKKYILILTVPVCLSMLANLIFLVNIVRVLVTKLKAVNSPDVNQTRKAVRATLILIPLLGLHYLVIPFSPEPGSTGYVVYQVNSAIITSFQGLCVSCLFCFCNGEILAQITRRLSQKRAFNSRSYSIAGTTVSRSRSSLRKTKSPDHERSPDGHLENLLPRWW